MAQRVAVGERLRARLAADAAQVVHRRLLTVGPTHQILRLRHLLVKHVGVLRRHLHRGRRAVAALEAAGTGGDLIQPDIRRAAADGFELHGQQLAAGIDRLSPVGKAPAQLTGAVGLVRGGQLRRKSAGGQCVISRAGGDADALEHIIVKLQMACKAADHGGPHIHRHGKAVLLRHSGGTGGQRQVAVLHRAVGHGDLGRLRHPLELLGHAAGRRAVARHHIGQIQRIGAGVLDLAHDGQHFRPLAGHACAALYAACAEVVGVSGVLIDAVSAVGVRPAVPQLRRSGGIGVAERAVVGLHLRGQLQPLRRSQLEAERLNGRPVVGLRVDVERHQLLLTVVGEVLLVGRHGERGRFTGQIAAAVDGGVQRFLAVSDHRVLPEDIGALYRRRSPRARCLFLSGNGHHQHTHQHSQ